MHRQISLDFNASPCGYAWDETTLISRLAITSDHPRFDSVVSGVVSPFGQACQLNLDHMFQFLAVHHANGTADVFVDEVPLILEFLSRKSVKAGELVFADNIADVSAVTFGNIALKPSDKIVFIFKKHWRFGLFFDLAHPVPTDPAANSKQLASLYKNLEFSHLYAALAEQDVWDRLTADGWFPYIEIAMNEFKLLVDAPSANIPAHAADEAVLRCLNPARIERMMEKWWDKQCFSDKRALLAAAADQFKQNTEVGNISCLKIVGTEIEGILRLHHFSASPGTGNVKTPELFRHMRREAQAKSMSPDGPLIHDKFAEFLQKWLFPKFDVATGALDLSRNTLGHGVAPASEYTRKRAAQYLLILDQLYHYL